MPDTSEWSVLRVALLQVTEESLATFFADCGTVMDCRICGDPNSAMRFAFIEFLEEAGAQEVRA
jgi:RNA recognition motif-containing protein